MLLNQYVETYLLDLNRAIQDLDRAAIEAVVEELARAWRERKNIFIMGNGGSAALASHMANDLCKLSSVPGQPRLRAIALTDNVPLLTAWANDTYYDRVFAEQLIGFCEPGDVVLAISCSGNSGNVLTALHLARELGARTIGFAGESGGKMADLVDICVRAPISPIYQQEDVHVVLNHLIASALHERLAAIAERLMRAPKALVLAAGEGTRLRPLTLDRPKPMVPINGAPLLDHTVGWLRQYGVEQIAINLHYRPEVITDYFGDGTGFGVQIHYSHEDSLLGSAGAVRKLDGFVDDAPLVVVYGDILTDVDLRALLSFHHENVVRDPSTGITLSLYPVPNPTEVGLVGMDASGRITRFVEKPRPEEVFTDLANAGVLVIEPWVIDSIPADTFYDFGLDLFPQLLAEGVAMYGWVIPHDAYLLDIGTHAKYDQAQYEWPLRQRTHESWPLQRADKRMAYTLAEQAA